MSHSVVEKSANGRIGRVCEREISPVEGDRLVTPAFITTEDTGIHRESGARHAAPRGLKPRFLQRTGRGAETPHIHGSPQVSLDFLVVPKSLDCCCSPVLFAGKSLDFPAGRSKDGPRLSCTLDRVRALC